VILWELFTGQEPWQEKTPMQARRRPAAHAAVLPSCTRKPCMPCIVCGLSDGAVAFRPGIGSAQRLLALQSLWGQPN